LNLARGQALDTALLYTQVGNPIGTEEVDRYYQDAPMTRINKGLFAVASYNAGPARIAGLRRKAEAQGLDPNVWFGNVEVVAARDIGSETVQYVSNIYKYYVAYTLLQQQADARKGAKAR